MKKHPELSILIIDSDNERCSRLEGALNTLGFSNSHQLKNLNSIEKVFENNEYQLLIISELKKKEETIQAFEFLQKQKCTKNVPKILLTKSNSTAFLRQLIEKGLNAVIKHPMELPALQQTMRNYLRVKQSKEVGKLIKEAEFFNEFSDAEIKTLVKRTILRRFDAGETIISKGAPSDHFFILIKGKVEVLFTNKETGAIRFVVEPGTPFGEISMLTHEPRTAFCIAADDCIVLEVGSQVIEDTNDVIRLKLMTKMAYLLAKRLSAMNKLVEVLEVEKTIPPQPIITKTDEEKEVSTPAEVQKMTIPKELESKKEKAPPKKETEEIENEDNNEEDEEDDEANKNPFATPTGTADNFSELIITQEEYDVLHRKINLRSDFIASKIPNPLREKICKRLYGYWIGSKLSKLNVQQLWNEKSFTPGSFRLKRALHMVVLCKNGDKAYSDSYLELPHSHRLVGLSQTGCVGTFLGNRDAIHRYLNEDNLEHAIELDMEIPIDRVWRGKDCIEYLTHTPKDVRDETLFLVIDEKNGDVTKRVREKFPQNQIITVVKDVGFKKAEPGSVFTYPEEYLKENGLLVPHKEFSGHGFYAGETYFLPDFSNFCAEADALSEWGFIFCTIGILGMIGPDYSGVTWGSQGGAEGAVKASRALFGIKGAQSSEDLARAINWADD